MEYGVGIHGEPGINREPLKTSAQLADTMVDALAKELGLTEKDRVAVLVNGFGATPLMELYLFYYDVAKKLAAKNILKLDAEIDALLNEPADTAAFKVSGAVDAITFAEYFKASTTDDDVCYGIETPVDYAAIEGKLNLNNLKYLVDAMSACIIENEVPFCELDSHAGDGDFGMSVAKGFRQLKREWKEISTNATDMSTFLHACSMVIMEHCGGATGPFGVLHFVLRARPLSEKIA